MLFFQSCLLCGKVLKNAADLKRHMYYYHKERACKHCGVEFSGTAELISHVTKEHSEIVQVRPFQTNFFLK